MKTTIFPLSLCLLLSTASAETISVSTLKSNEQIRIELSTRGCFHSDKRIYVIRGGDRKELQITEVVQRWDVRKNATVDFFERPDGSGILTAREVSGVDALIRYYRAPRRNLWCSTVDELTVEYRRDNLIVGTESFSDSTCTLGDRYRVIESDEKLAALLCEVVDLPEIRERIRKEAQPGATDNPDSAQSQSEKSSSN